MHTLGIILARAGSRGLKDKCVRPLLGVPLIEYTFAHALDAACLDDRVLSTDSAAAARLARRRGIDVLVRPAELASDTARVDDAARHALLTRERDTGRRYDIVVILYANIPVRAPGVIDRAVAHLRATGADSVRSVAPVGKMHPDWMFRLDGDRMEPLRASRTYRRQDLEPVYYHDGAVIAVTRAALLAATREDPQSFLGRDRRAIVQNREDAVDVDDMLDLLVAEAVLRYRGEPVPCTIEASQR